MFAKALSKEIAYSVFFFVVRIRCCCNCSRSVEAKYRARRLLVHGRCRVCAWARGAFTPLRVCFFFLLFHIIFLFAHREWL